MAWLILLWGLYIIHEILKSSNLQGKSFGLALLFFQYCVLFAFHAMLGNSVYYSNLIPDNIWGSKFCIWSSLILSMADEILLVVMGTYRIWAYAETLKLLDTAEECLRCVLYSLVLTFWLVQGMKIASTEYAFDELQGGNRSYANYLLFGGLPFCDRIPNYHAR